MVLLPSSLSQWQRKEAPGTRTRLSTNTCACLSDSKRDHQSLRLQSVTCPVVHSVVFAVVLSAVCLNVYSVFVQSSRLYEYETTESMMQPFVLGLPSTKSYTLAAAPLDSPIQHVHRSHSAHRLRTSWLDLYWLHMLRQSSTWPHRPPPPPQPQRSEALMSAVTGTRTLGGSERSGGRIGKGIDGRETAG